MYIRYSDKIPMISRWFLPSIHSFDQKSALLRHLYGAFRLARRIFLQLKSRDSLRVLKSLLRCHVFGGGLKICCGLVYAVFSVFVWSIFGCFRLSVWLIPVFIWDFLLGLFGLLHSVDLRLVWCWFGVELRLFYCWCGLGLVLVWGSFRVCSELFQGLLRLLFGGFNGPLGLCYSVDLGLRRHFRFYLRLCQCSVRAGLVLSWWCFLFYLLLVLDLFKSSLVLIWMERTPCCFGNTTAKRHAMGCTPSKPPCQQGISGRLFQCQHIPFGVKSPRYSLGVLWCSCLVSCSRFI